MNNNYGNSNYLYNYYDYNYYNSLNDSNDKIIESFNQNYINSDQNFDYKIASNIASNYRQCGNSCHPFWGYPQTGQQPYYDPNYSYNRLEPINSLQSPEEESFTNQLSYTQNQSLNYSEKSDKGFENELKTSFDNLIPLTVQEVEKQIKTEKEMNGNEGFQTNCFQIPKQFLQIGEICGQSFGQKENNNADKSTGLEMKSVSKTPRIRRKNRKLMSYEELKRIKRESNRLAATKCRQKKLQQLEVLDKRSKLLIEENRKLEQRLNEMKAQVYEKKLSLIYHRNSGCLLNAFRT